jgi:hypothetical protein
LGLAGPSKLHSAGRPIRTFQLRDATYESQLQLSRNDAQHHNINSTLDFGALTGLESGQVYFVQLLIRRGSVSSFSTR